MSEGFLSRWARLKRQRAAGAPVEGDAAQGPPAGEPERVPQDGEAQPAAPEAAAEPPQEEDLPPEELERLPPLDQITRETDLTPFMRKGIPAGLRNAALRRMWTLDPAIRDYVDDAREYAWDFNAPDAMRGFGALPEGFDARAAADAILGGGAPQRADSQEPDAACDEPAGTAADTPCDPPPSEADREISETTQAEQAGEVDPAAAGFAPSEEKQALPMASPPAGSPPRRRHGGAMPV